MSCELNFDIKSAFVVKIWYGYHRIYVFRPISEALVRDIYFHYLGNMSTRSVNNDIASPVIVVGESNIEYIIFPVAVYSVPVC